MVSCRQSNTAINCVGLVINNVLVAIKYYKLIYINIYNIICTPRLSSHTCKHRSWVREERWDSAMLTEERRTSDRTGEMINICLHSGLHWTTPGQSYFSIWTCQCGQSRLVTPHHSLHIWFSALSSSHPPLSKTPKTKNTTTELSAWAESVESILVCNHRGMMITYL